MDDYEYIVRELNSSNTEFDGKTILLCGSQGFLGRLFQDYFNYLNDKVLSNKCRVICIDQMVHEIIHPNFSYVQCDITNLEDLYDKLGKSRKSIDYLINLSGRASPASYSVYPLETIDVSVQGTRNILDLATEFGIKSVLMFSSSEVYGNPTIVPTPEVYLGGVETYCERACYDHGKQMLETLCYIYQTRFNTNVKVVRPFNILGYCVNDGRVVPNSVNKLLKGENLTVYLPGTQTRTFCWFSDFIIGSIKVLLYGDNKPYNIGNDLNEISMLDLANTLQSIAGLSNKIKLVEASRVYSTEPMRRCPDITKARKDLGYDPKIKLDDALICFWNWAKKEYV